METVILDGKKLENASEGHKYLKEMLRLPDYYGENLDALYDVLTEVGEDMEIQIHSSFQMNQGMRCVFEDAARENTFLNVIWRD